MDKISAAPPSKRSRSGSEQGTDLLAQGRIGVTAAGLGQQCGADAGQGQRRDEGLVQGTGDDQGQNKPDRHRYAGAAENEPVGQGQEQEKQRQAGKRKHRPAFYQAPGLVPMPPVECYSFLDRRRRLPTAGESQGEDGRAECRLDQPVESSRSGEGGRLVFPAQTQECLAHAANPAGPA